VLQGAAVWRRHRIAALRVDGRLVAEELGELGLGLHLTQRRHILEQLALATVAGHGLDAGLGGTRCGWDQGLAAGTRPAQIPMSHVHDDLRIGDVVDGGHAAVLYTRLLVQILTTGAKQSVVQDAAVISLCRSGSYRWSLIP
jgi:hypothetical protein